MTTMTGIDWTSDAECEAIRRETKERQRVAEYIAHARDMIADDRAQRWHRVKSIAVAVGVSALGVGAIVGLVAVWVHR